jgi:hypothetical protein
MRKLSTLLILLMGCVSGSEQLYNQYRVKHGLSKEVVYSNFFDPISNDSVPEANKKFCKENQCCFVEGTAHVYDFLVHPLGQKKHYVIAIDHEANGNPPDYLNVEFINEKDSVVFFKRIEGVYNQRDTTRFYYESRGDERYFCFDYENKASTQNPLKIEMDSLFYNDYGRGGRIDRPCSLACFKRTIYSVSFTSTK